VTGRPPHLNLTAEFWHEAGNIGGKISTTLHVGMWAALRRLVPHIGDLVRCHWVCSGPSSDAVSVDRIGEIGEDVNSLPVPLVLIAISASRYHLAATWPATSAGAWTSPSR
jgi:hypothetical protein